MTSLVGRMADPEELHVPDDGAVLTFGRSKFADNLPSRFWIKNDRITACACGDSHTAVITETHRVFVFGANEFSQLGLGHTNAVTRPTCIKVLKPEPCVHIACGKSHTVVCAENGRLFAFGLNQDGQLGLGHTDPSTTPAYISDWSTEVTQLGAGVSHTAALTVDGDVFVWGSNQEGQCGLGDSSSVLQPTQLACTETVVDISCGYRHTAFVTAGGVMFIMGDNDEGQLGLSSYESRRVPTAVPNLNDVVRVACGGMHTLALTGKGEVFAFGSGPEGQLGAGSKTLFTPTPKRIELDVVAKDIAAGHNHSAILTADNRLLMFGNTRYGKLCLQETPESNVFIPHPVEGLGRVRVQRAVLGGNQSMILVEPLPPSSSSVLVDLPPLNNGHQPSSDVHSAAREKRREKATSDAAATDASLENSLPSLGRTLPPLKNPASVPTTAPTSPPADVAQMQDVTADPPIFSREVPAEINLVPPTPEAVADVVVAAPAMDSAPPAAEQQPAVSTETPTIPETAVTEDKPAEEKRRFGNPLGKLFGRLKRKKSASGSKTDDTGDVAVEIREEPDDESTPVVAATSDPPATGEARAPAGISAEPAASDGAVAGPSGVQNPTMSAEPSQGVSKKDDKPNRKSKMCSVM